MKKLFFLYIQITNTITDLNRLHQQAESFNINTVKKHQRARALQLDKARVEVKSELTASHITCSDAVN